MGNNEIRTSTGTLSFTNKQVHKLMSLLNDKSGSTAHANMAVDVSELNITVGHSNVTPPKFQQRSRMDLKREKVLGTGSESAGLYVFDANCDKLAASNQKLPSSVLNGKSPFSLVYGREPNLSHIRSFSCLCFAAVVKGCDKFSKKAGKCVLI
ncbi:hypothetical protein Tco_1461880, partial [Tanacetum coccineum]